MKRGGTIAIKLSKQSHQKTTETRGKNFSLKMFRCRDEPIKGWKQDQTKTHKETTPLWKYGGEEKDTKTTLHLYVHCYS